MEALNKNSEKQENDIKFSIDLKPSSHHHYQLYICVKEMFCRLDD